MKVEIDSLKFDLSKIDEINYDNTIVKTENQEFHLTEEQSVIFSRVFNFYQKYCFLKTPVVSDEIKSEWRQIRDYIAEGDKYKKSICVFTNPDGTKVLK